MLYITRNSNRKKRLYNVFPNMRIFNHPLIVYYSTMQNQDFGAFLSQSEGANVEWDNPIM